MTSLHILAYSYLIACSEAILEMHAVAEAPEATLGHDADAVSQDVGLLHAVRGEHDAAVLLGCLDHVPHVPAPKLVYQYSQREQTKRARTYLRLMGSIPVLRRKIRNISS